MKKRFEVRMFGFFKRRRRRRLMGRPFPPDWLGFIERNVPYYRHLPPDDRRELQGLIQVFLAEKQFEGCGGLRLTDEIRITIAAQACILLLHRETDFYPNLISILVYPDIFVAPVHSHDPIGTMSDEVEEYTGESWDRGALVLSWSDVVEDAADIHDGYNVVFHEFAHQLDGESGSDDGAPNLPDASMYGSWSRVLGREYRRLVRDIGRGRETLLDEYGAEDPAEFFAVATEFFFEMPVELKARHPELYAELRKFYRQDPA
ncbi:MAG TPA: M90 family metallopeptidase, partial [Patescibacteria group bacterium]|nr:M90 family metallopeptidase [Patescibacteria group bacterium]